MPDAVQIIAGAAVVGRQKGEKERLWQRDNVSHSEELEASSDDSVTISAEALQRSQGRQRKTILEYLADESE